VCSTNEVDDLLQTHRMLNNTFLKSEDQHVKVNKISSAVNGQLKMAEILRNYHLDQT
jgi:hypothetical protein